MTMRSLKYCMTMWILEQQFADKDPQAHSRRTGSGTGSGTAHSQPHRRQWQANYVPERVRSTMSIDPFELRQRELDTEIENHHSRNGHVRRYNVPSRAARSTGFDQSDSHEGGPPRWLTFAEFSQWQRDHGDKSFNDGDRLRHGRATRSTSFDRVESYHGRPPPDYGDLRELLGYNRHRSARKGTSVHSKGSHDPPSRRDKKAKSDTDQGDD